MFRFKRIKAVIFFLGISCTNNQTQKTITVQVEKYPETEACEFERGFNDSIEDKGLSDICFYLDKSKYRKGFTSGNIYTAKRNQVEAIEKKINERSNNLTQLIRSGLFFDGISEDVKNEMNDISELKKEVFYLKSEMESLKKGDITL